jgi:hypothetical protein
MHITQKLSSVHHLRLALLIVLAILVVTSLVLLALYFAAPSARSRELMDDDMAATRDGSSASENGHKSALLATGIISGVLTTVVVCVLLLVKVGNGGPAAASPNQAVPVTPVVAETPPPSARDEPVQTHSMADQQVVTIYKDNALVQTKKSTPFSVATVRELITSAGQGKLEHYCSSGKDLFLFLTSSSNITEALIVDELVPACKNRIMAKLKFDQMIKLFEQYLGDSDTEDAKFVLPRVRSSDQDAYDLLIQFHSAWIDGLFSNPKTFASVESLGELLVQLKVHSFSLDQSAEREPDDVKCCQIMAQCEKVIGAVEKIINHTSTATSIGSGKPGVNLASKAKATTADGQSRVEKDERINFNIHALKDGNVLLLNRQMTVSEFEKFQLDRAFTIREFCHNDSHHLGVLELYLFDYSSQASTTAFSIGDCLLTTYVKKCPVKHTAVLAFKELCGLFTKHQGEMCGEGKSGLDALRLGNHNYEDIEIGGRKWERVFVGGDLELSRLLLTYAIWEVENGAQGQKRPFYIEMSESKEKIKVVYEEAISFNDSKLSDEKVDSLYNFYYDVMDTFDKVSE